MNIQQAVEQLESTVRAYTARTKEGALRIPVSAQRPVYLEGPPGVGKTAIMAQLARKLNVGLVSYTMTHHTRQSALGLPLIQQRSFDGQQYSVTEYTMSEIIASVYEHIEQTHCDAGILFLDEINCVSETLTPAMLELLQHKRFGSHRLPEGWVVVCAGNPVQYNRNARALDAVTLDRVRLMRIEPDVQAWQDYAAQAGVHPSICAYLRLRPEDFYIAEDGNIVTPRSWCDLSDMLKFQEEAEEAPGKLLFSQYLQCESICERFSLYYALCKNVARSFQLDAVLLRGERISAGHFASVSFDEALCCAEMLAQRLAEFKRTAEGEKSRANRLSYFIEAALRESCGTDSGISLIQICQQRLQRREEALLVRKRVGALSNTDEAQEKALHALIRSALAEAMGSAAPGDCLKRSVQTALDAAMQAQQQYDCARQNALAFAEVAFGGESFQALLCRDIIQRNAQKRMNARQ